MSTQDSISYIESRIRNIPDFPKKGILFKDITPLLADYNASNLTYELLIHPFKGQKIDLVVGLESRGFIFGPKIANGLRAGFVPVRKPGKLPYRTRSATYELEYGTDSLEIHEDAIQSGQQVLIHDDLIATGGTAAAATQLVHSLGGIVAGYAFIIELTALKGVERLELGKVINSVLKY